MGNKHINSKKNKINDGIAVERQACSPTDKDMVITTLVRRNQFDGPPESMPKEQLLPTNVDTDESIAIALYDFKSENKGSLNFAKGRGVRGY